MALLHRFTAVWSGAPGLPGYTQFYASITDPPSGSAQDGVNAVRTFFAGLSSLIPEEIGVLVDSVYQTIDEATGAIVAEGVVSTPPSNVAGGFVGGWNAQVGVLVEWATAAFIGGRRLRGRTYLVPIGGTGDANGTLPAATFTIVDDAAYGLASSAVDFRVWHRPVGGVGGSSSSITQQVIRDHAATLTSRMR